MTDAQTTTERAAEPNVFNVRFVVSVGAGLCVLMVAAMVLMGALFHVLARRVSPPPKEEPSLNAVRQQQVEPPLNVDKQRQLKELREAETNVLIHYRWIDQEKGIVQIPIESAIDILAERGLPARPAKEEGQ